MVTFVDRFQLHRQQHFLHRSGWLRAAVLGANDGILSTASIVTGVIAGGASHAAVVLAGIAGLVAGAGSMATGEYVSVSSQMDIEQADLAREKHELAANPKFEHEELAHIEMERGLDPALARDVARQLMVHDALGAHARDELGISETVPVRPLQAASSSAASFALGAALPLLTAVMAPAAFAGRLVSAMSLLALAILGVVAARIAGSPILRPSLRVVLWGALSMGVTALIGHLVGTQL
jgi:VIT1/CCC1 family predicted Fe2+/Mn2+ transporter